LSDPAARKEYDRRRRPIIRGEEPSIDGDLVLRGHHLRSIWWVALIGVMAVIFVVTAYAGGPARRSPLQPAADRCLATLPGYDAIVPCSQPNAGRVVFQYATPSASAACPPGSTPHPYLGRAEVVCLAPPP
jgi:hypothetical protein